MEGKIVQEYMYGPRTPKHERLWTTRSHDWNVMHHPLIQPCGTTPSTSSLLGQLPGSVSHAAAAICNDQPLQPSHVLMPNETPATLLTKLDVIITHVSDDSNNLKEGGSSQVEEDRNSLNGAIIANMAPMERESWEAYLRGTISLPSVNWNHARGEAPTGKKGLKTALRRAEALNRLYQIDTVQSFHYVWFVSNHIEALPLVKAMARVIGAERQFGVTGEGLLDLKKLQNIRNVLAIARRIHQSHQKVSKLHSSAIHKRLELLTRQQRDIIAKRKRMLQETQ